MTSHILFCLYILEDTAQRFGNLETRTGQVEDQVHSLEGTFNVSMKSLPGSLIYKGKLTGRRFKQVKDHAHCLDRVTFTKDPHPGCDRTNCGN